MLTQEQIESKNFTYWRTSEESSSNDRPNRDDYLAVGVTTENVRALLLSYDTNGYLTVTDYFNNPIRYREYYLGYQLIDTEEELDEALDTLEFTIEKINLETLTVDFE